MFDPDPITTLTPLYLLALALLTGWWLLTVRQQAGRGEQPRLSLLTAPGLAALGAAPLTGTPALFGVGAALVLLGCYLPRAYAACPLPAHRAGMLLWGGALVSVPAVLALLISPGDIGPALALLGLLAVSLAGLALGMGSVLAPPAPLFPTLLSPTPLGLNLRFGPVTVPPAPELQLRLDGQRAHLLNISGEALLLAGWSAGGEPRGPGRNGWLPARGEGGAPLWRLERGHEAQLWPWPPDSRSLNVWYLGERQPERARLFRAEWTPPGEGTRVLN